MRVVAPTVALFAILIIPVALAVRQVVRRQVQSLAEAVATGLLAGSVAAVANIALQRGDIAPLVELAMKGVRVEIAVRALADAPGKVRVERERWSFEHGDTAIRQFGVAGVPAPRE